MEQWRRHTNNQLLILDDLKMSKMSVDKVTHFGVRPPELLKICDKLGDCYFWFHISKNKVKVADFPMKLNEDIYHSCWIDGFQRQVRIRKKALPEIFAWCGKLEKEPDYELDDYEQNSLVRVILLIYDINRIYQVDVSELNNEDE